MDAKELYEKETGGCVDRLCYNVEYIFWLEKKFEEGEKAIKLISKIWDVIGDIEDDKPDRIEYLLLCAEDYPSK